MMRLKVFICLHWLHKDPVKSNNSKADPPKKTKVIGDSSDDENNVIKVSKPAPIARAPPKPRKKTEPVSKPQPLSKPKVEQSSNVSVTKPVEKGAVIKMSDKSKNTQKEKILGDSSDDEVSNKIPAKPVQQKQKILGDSSDDEASKVIKISPAEPKQTKSKVIGDSSDDEADNVKVNVISIKEPESGKRKDKILGDSDNSDDIDKNHNHGTIISCDHKHI